MGNLILDFTKLTTFLHKDGGVSDLNKRQIEMAIVRIFSSVHNKNPSS
jgi:hypothetical protein